MSGWVVREGPSWLYRVRRVVAVAGLVALTGVWVVGVTSGVLATTASPGGAQPLPHCGGQNAAPQPVPYTCELPGRTIDGTLVSAIVHADGTHVTVTYHLDAPRPVDTAIRIGHHDGVSGAGLALDLTFGSVPAGATTATLVGSSPCRDGQLDVRFFFLTNGDKRGAVGGPWIRNGTGCTTVTTTTTTTSTTTTSIPTTTIPSTTSVTTGPQTTPPATVSQSRVSTALPVTGMPGASGVKIALLAVAIGCFLVVLAARRTGDEADH